MFESKINRGRANGYAPLDGSGKVPLDKLPPIQSTIDTGSFATTSSLQTLIDVTGSFATTSSLQTLVDVTGSFATTGSNTFFGEQTVSGSLLLAGNIGGALALVDNVEIFTSQINFVPNSSGEPGSNLSTIQLVPDVNSPSADQMLIIDPTAGVPNHIHLRPGGEMDNSSTSIILGGESSNVSVVGGQNPPVQITANNYVWQFETNGTILFPDYSVQTTAFTGINSSSFATTGSNTFNGNQTISGSVYADNLVGLVSSSVQVADFGFISSASQLTSSYDARYTLSGSVQPLPSNLISSSAQISAFGFISSSQIIDTGSLLTTESFNTFSSSVDTRLDTLEESIITGSPNYVQTLRQPLRGVTTTGVIIITGSITTTGNPVQIMVTGDANPISTGWTRLQIFRDGNGIGGIVQVENGSNLNVPYCLNVIDTPSAGTYTYSMRTVSGIAGTFDFGEHNGPTLTAVELRTNTNLPSVNNTFTGNNTFRGITTFATVGGDEGGEVEFGVPSTNTSLSTRVVTDIWRDRFRIFDGNSKGVFIDLSKAPTGVGGELMHKASGFVNRGVDVTLGNLKARIAATGNASLQLSTVSGTYSIHGSGVYSQASAIAGVTLSTQLSVTTTPTYIVSGYNFGVAGATDTWNIADVNLGIAWRITMIVGFGYNNNFISIERLH